MKHELIKTDYHLLVVNDEEIKEDMWFYNPILNAISINSNADGCKKVIAHLPLKDLPVLEGVDLLPPLPQGKDANLSELHKAYADCTDCSIVDFTIGYNKAKEKYKYTERQLDEAIDWGIRNGRKGDVTIMDIDSYIQSINQLKLPIAFECETETPFVDGFTEDRVRRFYGNPEPKTITNSQGNTEWVGTYIYN
jgi:hypothetical protein